MQDPGGVLETWGYVGISVVLILGNMGLPIPEEAILILGGYLVWEGKLRLPIVLGVDYQRGLGDNLVLIGCRFAGVERKERWFFVTPRAWTRSGSPLRSASDPRHVPSGCAPRRPVAGISGLRPALFLRTLGARSTFRCRRTGHAIGLG
jgi:hypothetical protein